MAKARHGDLLRSRRYAPPVVHDRLARRAYYQRLQRDDQFVDELETLSSHVVSNAKSRLDSRLLSEFINRWNLPPKAREDFHSALIWKRSLGRIDLAAPMGISVQLPGLMLVKSFFWKKTIDYAFHPVLQSESNAIDEFDA